MYLVCRSSFFIWPKEVMISLWVLDVWFTFHGLLGLLVRSYVIPFHSFVPVAGHLFCKQCIVPLSPVTKYHRGPFIVLFYWPNCFVVHVQVLVQSRPHWAHKGAWFKIFWFSFYVSQRLWSYCVKYYMYVCLDVLVSVWSCQHADYAPGSPTTPASPLVPLLSSKLYIPDT